MQQLLTGKKRLPGFTGEWKKVKAGLILKVYQYVPINKKFFFLQLKNMVLFREIC